MYTPDVYLHAQDILKLSCLKKLRPIICGICVICVGCFSESMGIVPKRLDFRFHAGEFVRVFLSRFSDMK